jgi:hypothetical protein
MPTASDLVTDLPADFETFGQAVATSMADLLGGTSGQVLSKASNTDMDFTWVAQDDSNAIQNSIVDAKGDIVAASANDTPARLAVGANDLLLTAASGETTGLKWAGAWTTWTPTRNGITVGNGTEIARYTKMGKVVFFEYKFILGSTSAISNDPGISLPLTAVTQVMGISNFLDAGTMYYQGQLDSSTTFAYFVVGNASGTYLASSYPTSGVPFTWTTGDGLNARGFYEVA